MIFIKNKKWVALLAVLALAISLPASALAADDTTPPVATLYSPSVSAAATANQKIIFSLSEKVTLVGGKSITVSAGGVDYIASAGAGTVVGDAALGPWYAVYDLGDFSNGGSPLSLAVGTTYQVAAEAGAFADLAATPNVSAAASGSFTTVADGSLFAVVFTTTAANQTVTAGDSAIVSGQAVANGTLIVFTIPADSSYIFHRAIKVNGAASSPDLSGYALAGDLEVYITRTSSALSGTPVISGNAYLGVTLSATLSGLNQPDLSGITLKWVRVDGATETEVATGNKDTTYTLVEADIGKTIRLDVTDSVLTGTVSAITAAVTKVPFVGSVTKPVALTVTDVSVVLQSVSGYEYMRTGGTWQDSTTFSGLSAGIAYDFYQRVKETGTTLASDTSEKTTITTVAGLTGTPLISGTAQSGRTLTASLSGSNASGTISYVWQRGGATVGTGATYLLGSADVGQVITLYVTASEQSGTLSAATATVLKAENTTVPAAPTMASATATSITLNAASGYQYSLGGTYWQDTTTFHNLTAGATYTFYQRVAETATALASAPSPSVNFTTLPTLSGMISTTGEARFGMTMTATLSGSNNTGTLTYTWKRGNTIAGTGVAYAVSAADIGNQLSLEVTSSVQGGSVTRSLGTVAKAYYIGDAPDAPTRSSRTTTKIVLNTVGGCEYSRGGTTWQDSTTFSGLKSGTSYTFYQRYKATATIEASPLSAAYKTSTSAASSSDDDTSATPTPKPSTTDSGSTALFTYTLTPDNTRILYSTMKSLAEGNKTQDVTIKQDNVEFTFPKGTMTQSYTQLWYDFGATINNSIAVQTAQMIAGDAHVATVHYNYNGELPGRANIRLNIGAAHTGKTLYYYLLDADNTLTFQQTAIVDNSGWTSVSQTHCSDYVFLDRDIESVSASPSPSPDASASPLPSPTVSPDAGKDGLGSNGWFIAAIILIAVALIVGGIWLYTKNRDDKIEDEDENEDENSLF
ncbi:MAG: hypothetical protein Q8S22_08065 [Eubacteriales bacterium]|jgi:hypothetical protein|nr:hypothetical protein [Eubacteriales bacterium]